MCGLGVGVALAVGLKYSWCDDEGAQRTDRYRSAVNASRDLLERIKVGEEVGLGHDGRQTFSCSGQVQSPNRGPAM